MAVESCPDAVSLRTGAAGDIARQIDGLLDGSKVQLRVTE